MRRSACQPDRALKGVVRLIGDKSIAHRAAILSGISRGTTVLHNFPLNDDCLATLEALSAFGVRYSLKRDPGLPGSATIRIKGRGLSGFTRPRSPVFIRESGTTFRLLLGVAAGQPFTTSFRAGPGLSRRPMMRVVEPLRLMGCVVKARQVRKAGAIEVYPPLSVQGGSLTGITYSPRQASAQVKSALLLAGLYAGGTTAIREPVPTRDHTERMMRMFNIPVSVRGGVVSLKGGHIPVSPRDVRVPGDISSALFFIVAGLLSCGSHIVVKGVSLNPGRTGALSVLERMGARMRVTRSHPGKNGEPAGDITVFPSTLKSARVRKGEVPSLIDELPVLMVAASLARGTTVFEGVQELRVKETDRIESMRSNLSAMGVKVRVSSSGRQEDVAIQGVPFLKGARVHSRGDHRTAMSMVVAGLLARGKTRIEGLSCVSKSFPGFIKAMDALRQG